MPFPVCCRQLVISLVRWGNTWVGLTSHDQTEGDWYNGFRRFANMAAHENRRCSVWLAQLVKEPTLSQIACMHVHSCMTVRKVRGSTPGTDNPNSGFHPFKVDKWVATITNSGWLMFEKWAKWRISGTEIFKIICVELQELTVACNGSSDNGLKITLLPRGTAIIITRQSSRHTHTPHTP